MKPIYEQYVDTLKSTNSLLLLNESKIPCLSLRCRDCPYDRKEVEDCISARKKDFDASAAYYQKTYPEDFL
jgi:hypothetical protein